MSQKSSSLHQETNNSWMGIIKKYSKPLISMSVWQLINSVVPYLFLWVLMYKSLSVSYWLTLALALISLGFLTRIFIIFHDCGHNSFFKNKRLNTLVGMFLGLFTFTAFYKWQRSHQGHHETVGNLDKRGVGDVMTLTVEEYKSASKAKQRFYRIYRNPFVLFFIGGIYIFLIQNRFTNKTREKKERINIYLTNLVILGILAAFYFTIGLKSFIIIQLPIIWMASTVGVFLFYVQHQYEDVVWERSANWDYKTMALEGSSFFKLPRILQWFTGSIGFHHVHHLGPRIPNYYLEKAHLENDLFLKIKPITLLQSLNCLSLRLWDEKNNRIVKLSEIS
jgi:omega-6 fatty acid desaturase (delta-12 desaturase)